MSAVALGDPGPLVLSTDVDAAVVSILKQWLPTHLRILSDERSLDVPLPSPRGANYRTMLDRDEIMDSQLPAVLVQTAKTQGRTERHADGTITADWSCVVSCVVRGTVPSETWSRAALYEGAVRRSLGHRNVVDGTILHSLAWQGAEVAPVPDVSRQGRYLVAGMSTFLAKTDNALRDTAGPPTPDPSSGPPPAYVPTGTITDVETSVTSLPIDQDSGGD